jgi:hypothetical protein
MIEGHATTDLGTISATSYTDVTGATVTVPNATGSAFNARVSAHANGTAGGNTQGTFFAVFVNPAGAGFAEILDSEEKFVQASTLGIVYAWTGEVQIPVGGAVIKLMVKNMSASTIAINATGNAPGGNAGVQVVYPVL